MFFIIQDFNRQSNELSRRSIKIEQLKNYFSKKKKQSTYGIKIVTLEMYFQNMNRGTAA